MHTAFFRMNLIIQHGRNVPSFYLSVVHGFFQHYGCNTGWPHVFLGAGINKVEFIEVQTAGKNVRRHVANQGNRTIRKGLHLRTKNGIVRSAVEIIGFFRDLISLGNIGEILVF